jgi:ribonuclease BN (tRNA processing enzyme)
MGNLQIQRNKVFPDAAHIQIPINFALVFMAALTFLGTSGSVVTKERMCAGILFEDKLIDVGFGVLANMIRAKVRLDSINTIFISHTHSDHIGDFTGLIWAMAMANRTKPIRVISSTATAAVLEKILELQSTPRGWVKFDINFQRPESVRARYVKTMHLPETLAYRFDVGGSDFVYGGDSLRYDKLAEFARGCDLLIHDATFLDGQESIAKITNHSTARDAGEIATLAGARRLALTHIAPTNEGAHDRYKTEGSAVFDGEVILAQDQLTLSV